MYRQILLDNSEHADLIDSVSIFEDFKGPTSISSLLQKEAYPPYHSFPGPKRLEIIRKRCSPGYDLIGDEPKIMALILHNGKPPFTKEMICEHDKDGNTILHHALKGYAYVERIPQNDTFSDDIMKLDFDHELYPWRVLIKGILDVKPDFSHKNSFPQTPVVYFIQALVKWYNLLHMISSEPEVTAKLRTYLKELHIAGIDLKEYGERETQSNLLPGEDLRSCNSTPLW